MFSNLELVQPFSFNSNPSLADRANLLGKIRQQKFQFCLSFAQGLLKIFLLSMNNINLRISENDFIRTKNITFLEDWPAQGYINTQGKRTFHR